MSVAKRLCSGFLVLGLGCSSQAKLTPEQAEIVAAAEDFVAANGYTDSEAVPPIEYESIEWGRTDEEILSARRGTLLPRAYGLISSEDGWVVLFRYATEPDASERGRGVTANRVGNNMRVEHQDIFLSAAGIVLDR